MRCFGCFNYWDNYCLFHCPYSFECEEADYDDYYDNYYDDYYKDYWY